MDRFEPHLTEVVLGHRGQRLAADRGGNAAHDLDETGGTGVDDAGLLQHGEHVARLRDGGVARGDDAREVGLSLGGVCHRADRGEHRPLDRLLHRTVGGVTRRPECLREIVTRCERLGRAADDLREDHARVAACSHQGCAGDFLREPGSIIRPVAVE